MNEKETLKQRLRNFLYNEDRAIASAAGAPPQETISSETGRLYNRFLWAAVLHEVLDEIQPNHCENAVAHADRLDAADNGDEK